MIEAYFDELGEYACGVNVYSIFESNELKFKYILAYLNSKLASWLFRTLFYDKHLAGKYISINATLLRELPIKEISLSKQQPFITLVDNILSITRDSDYSNNPKKQSKVSAFKGKIDKMVNELYGLTPEEIDIIENFNKK